MNWLLWKQHRKQFLILAIILALYGALAIPMGIYLWHSYQTGLTACKQAHDCQQLSNNLFGSGWSMELNPSASNGFRLVNVLLLTVPFLLGMFMGVPLIAREYSAKTNLLVWTRSISRKKWLTMKFVWILIAAALFTGGMSVLTTFWAKAGNTLYMNRFSTGLFYIQGIAPIGYAVLAVSMGIALGAWLKRTMAAIGITLLLMIAVQIVVGNLVRPHYMTPLSTTNWTNQIGPGYQLTGVPSGSWVTGSNIVNKQGQTLSWSNPPKQCVVPADQLPQTPRQTSPSGQSVHEQGTGSSNGATTSITSINGGPNVSGSCLEKAGYHYIISYQPANRYWEFQSIELGLYLIVSIVPIGFTYWLVLKRDA